MNFYSHHLGDYSKATAHLSLLEDGAYRRMIDLYYSTEKPLPLDVAVLMRLLRVKEPYEKRAVETVLKEFFHKQKDGWHKARCDVEIMRAHEKRTKAQQSAMLRWQSERNANASQKLCEGNAPNPNPNPNPIKKQLPLAKASKVVISSHKGGRQ